MIRDDFERGLRSHFGIVKWMLYVDHEIWVFSRNYVINVVKFDEWLHEQFGNYEKDRKMSAYEVIEAEYGLAAKEWLKRSCS